MPELKDMDNVHLEAAEGWLGLGLPLDALEELEKISHARRALPDFLHVRYEICAASKQWESAAEVAKELCRISPDAPSGFIQLAYSLHELRRTTEALNALLTVADRFPDVPTISYNLACYHCQLGDLPAASKCLKRALKLGGAANIKKMALGDLDLKPLWESISNL